MWVTFQIVKKLLHTLCPATDAVINSCHLGSNGPFQGSGAGHTTINNAIRNLFICKHEVVVAEILCGNIQENKLETRPITSDVMWHILFSPSFFVSSLIVVCQRAFFFCLNTKLTWEFLLRTGKCFRFVQCRESPMECKSKERPRGSQGLYYKRIIAHKTV